MILPVGKIKEEYSLFSLVFYLYLDSEIYRPMLVSVLITCWLRYHNDWQWSCLFWSLVQLSQLASVHILRKHFWFRKTDFCGQKRPWSVIPEDHNILEFMVEPIRSQRLPLFIVARGHNIIVITLLKICLCNIRMFPYHTAIKNNDVL